MTTKFTDEPKPLRIHASKGTQLIHTSTHINRQNQSWSTTVTQKKKLENTTTKKQIKLDFIKVYKNYLQNYFTTSLLYN